MADDVAPTAVADAGKIAPGLRSAKMYQLCLIAFTVELGLGIVVPLLPQIMREFALTSWQTGMMITVYGLARLITDLPVGYLAERVDRGRLLILGAALIGAGSFGCGLATDFTFLLGARLVMGMGTGVCLLTILYSVSRGAKAHTRGRIIGVYQASVLAGISVSPAIGGAAASLFSWRAAFFFCTFAAAVAILMILFIFRAGSVEAAPEALPADEGAESESNGTGTRRAPWDLVAICFTTWAFFMSNSGFRNSALPLFAGNQLEIGPGMLGLLLGGAAVIRFLITLASGFASDRFGRKVILFPGILLLVVGTLGFPYTTDLAGFTFFLVIISLGGFGNSLPTTMVVDVVPPQRVALSLGINRFTADLGILIGPVALGWLLDVAGFQAVAVATAALLLATIPGVALTVREKRAPLRPRAA